MHAAEPSVRSKTTPADPYQIPLLIGVVGHRDLAPEELPAIRAAVTELLRDMRGRHPEVRGTLLTSMADGADLLVAEVAAALDFPIIAVLPFSVDACRAELQTAEARATFDRLLGHAEHLVISGADARPANETATAEWRERQFQHAGGIVAHYSTLLIAIWDGKDTESKAGTARVVKDRRRGRITDGDDEVLSGNVLLSGNDNDLIFEIRCSRRSSGSEARRPNAAPLLPEVIGFVGHDVKSGTKVPPQLESILSRTAEFNRDVINFHAGIERSGRRLSSPSPDPVPERLTYLDHLFRASDWLGRLYRRWFMIALRTRYFLWFAMALLLLSFKKDPDEVAGFTAILGVLLVFGLAGVLALWAHRRNWHRKYLDYRALAEGLRVDFYWEIAGVRSQFGGEFAHESFLQKQDIELEWIRAAMRSVSLRLAVSRGARPTDGFAQAFAGWVGDDDPVNGSGQLLYYRRRSEAMERHIEFQERVWLWILIAGLVLATTFAIELGFSPHHHAMLAQNVRVPMEWALAGLTVFAGVFDTYVSEKADLSLVRQYRYMFTLFSVAARELRSATSEVQKLEILKSLGHACLAEHAQWILAHRDRRIEGLRW